MNFSFMIKTGKTTELSQKAIFCQNYMEFVGCHGVIKND